MKWYSNWWGIMIEAESDYERNLLKDLDTVLSKNANFSFCENGAEIRIRENEDTYQMTFCKDKKIDESNMIS